MDIQQIFGELQGLQCLAPKKLGNAHDKNRVKPGGVEGGADRGPACWDGSWEGTSLSGVAGRLLLSMNWLADACRRLTR